MPESDEQKQQREFEKALLVYRRNCTIMNDKRECSSSIVNTLQPENVILLRFEYDGLKKDKGSEVQHNLQSRGPEGTTKHKKTMEWCDADGLFHKMTKSQKYDKKSWKTRHATRRASKSRNQIQKTEIEPRTWTRTTELKLNWTLSLNEQQRMSYRNFEKDDCENAHASSRYFWLWVLNKTWRGRRVQTIVPPILLLHRHSWFIACFQSRSRCRSKFSKSQLFSTVNTGEWTVETAD